MVDLMTGSQADGQHAPESRQTNVAGFLITSDKDSCRECWGCIRYCPARAIRVVSGHSEIIEERCVKCGLCVSECGNSGHQVRDDSAAVVGLLNSGRPVVAVLATEFTAAMHPLTPPEVERALEALGFFAVESTLLGEEMVASEYEKSHARACSSVTLRSTCAVAVDWVRIFYPNLVPALSPIIPPYVAQARLVKEIYPPGTAVVYVSPCYARKDEAYDPEFAGAVDAAIDFSELEHLMQGLPADSFSTTPPGARRPSPVKELSLTDGFPRRTLEERSRTDSSVVAVRGLTALDDLLAAIHMGETAPFVVDMLNCEGCIDGPAVRPGMSVFAKRNIIAADQRETVAPRIRTRDLLGFLPPVEMRRSFTARPASTSEPTFQEIESALIQGEFMTPEQHLDCGACGHVTCREHAAAVARGDSSWDTCFPLQRQRMVRAAHELELTASADALTGLGNRRAFDERLAGESARHARYGGELSLLMMDIDGFKSINDAHGHVVGDAVLQAVSAIIRHYVRETDMAARYGGDEFALILPGTGAAAAAAVGEKLRRAVADCRVVPGDSIELNITISVGTASMGGSTVGHGALLEASDRAMYAAKREGKNQVHSAPD